MLKINFNSEPIYGDNDKYIKTKIKIYGGSVNTNFQGKKKPREKAPCKSLSIIMLGSVVKVKKKYYLQTLLEDCKHERKEINDLEKVHPMTQIMKLTMILMIKWNLTKIMMNPMNNSLKAKNYVNNNKSPIVYVNHASLGFLFILLVCINGLIVHY